MSLYDDLDGSKEARADKTSIAGWSSGIKLLQSQLQLKKAATTQPRRDQLRKASLAPVIDLKAKQRDLEEDSIYPHLIKETSHNDWDDVLDEYDPLWPNEYEKVVKEMRDCRDREVETREERLKRDKSRRKSRFADSEEAANATLTAGGQLQPPQQPTGFAGRSSSASLYDDPDELDDDAISTMKSVAGGGGGGGGVAIAPPASLQEHRSTPTASQPAFTRQTDAIFASARQTDAILNPPPTSGNNYGGVSTSIAAKIMAKYGFKEGQGLGKKEQGMAIALQVEKTSKRGGRIIHEKELMQPQIIAPPPPPPPPPPPTTATATTSSEPSITEILRKPSKVVLLRNMVGAGEVDDDLEPEVKDECNTKYGDVVGVIIHEMPKKPTLEGDETEEELEEVRIFVEFKRIESAIKAVVDLNGRFFGGRTVRAGFYDFEKFNNMQLLD